MFGQRIHRVLYIILHISLRKKYIANRAIIVKDMGFETIKGYCFHSLTDNEEKEKDDNEQRQQEKTKQNKWKQIVCTHFLKTVYKKILCCIIE